MNRKILAAALVLVALVVGGIFSFREGVVSLPGPKPKAIVDANNQFALDYYSKVKEKEIGNIFFSPFSISSAFVMTYEGARGQTADEMRSVFYFPEDENLRRSEYASLFSEINKGNKEYELTSANALWAERNYRFLENYLGNVETYYGGKATNLDFVNNSEGSRVRINDWVEDQTKSRIKDLIPSGAINGSTRLVLTNAVYFKGEWIKTFNEDETKEEDFRTNENETVKVQMMRRLDEEATFGYMENDYLQILEMPYSGDELSALFLLPKDDSLEDLEDLLSIENLLGWKRNLKEQQVKVYIPKFKFETKYFMSGDLREMGMPLAFSDSADFSGMTGNKDLKISEAIHQAFVEVNEEGTEAAAATAVVVGLKSVASEKIPEIPIFRADHSFIFLIQQKDTGNILFIGRVANPNS